MEARKGRTRASVGEVRWEAERRNQDQSMCWRENPLEMEFKATAQIEVVYSWSEGRRDDGAISPKAIDEKLVHGSNTCGE